jgi:hypothetical protein
MRDDESDGKKTEATTIPPPAGESDIYEAKTQVGGLPPEALEMLRALRDETPSLGRGGEANVPVFVEEEEPPRPRPAAGLAAAKPAESEAPTSTTGTASKRDPFAPDATPEPAEPPPPPKPELRPSRPPSPSVLSAEEAVPPVFSTSSPPAAKDSIPPLIGPGSLGVADMDDDNYAAVFGPLPPSTAHPLLSKPPPPPAPPSSGQIPLVLWLMGGLVVLVFLALFWVVLTRSNPPAPSPPTAPAGSSH